MASTDLIRDAVDAALDRRYPGTTAQPAVNADVIVLAAAGNCIGLVVWLARLDECIAVARSDISAPAEKAWRATVPNGSGQGQGTSFAVAPAAGPDAPWLYHDGRDSFSMGAGIVDARALLSVTDFDLDRERESTAAPAGLRENAALGVASFAAEEIRPAAALQDPRDWYLDNAVSKPVQRDAVGLGGAETEAGTGVGTGVEGGGR
jgi:hypothetical protein